MLLAPVDGNPVSTRGTRCVMTATESAIMGGMDVLIVEDNPDLLGNLVDYLEASGHSVHATRDGVAGLNRALEAPPDAVELDLGLPGMDGLDVCRRLREAGCTAPVLVLTARSALDDRVDGLDTGADDYLVKPVAMRELEARLRAHHRRSDGPRENARLRCADLSLDPGTRHVERAGRALELSRMEYEILALLLRAAPDVVTRQQLAEALWPDAPPGHDTLRAHVYRLRRAVDHPFDRPLVHTVHGVGYRIAAHADATP